jgi:urea transport system permease protein
MSSWFTGGSAPNINLGFYEIKWTDWWLVLLGVSFVLVTLYFPKGVGGIFDALVRKTAVERQGDYGPDKGAWRNDEGKPS